MLKLKLELCACDAYNPRIEESDENIGTLCLWHGKLNLGDDIGNYQPKEYLVNMMLGNRYKLESMTIDQLEKLAHKHYLFLPVYGKEHGGLTISTRSFGDEWDSGRIGFIYCLKDESDLSDDDALLHRLQIEVERYDFYLQNIAFEGRTIIYSEDREIIDIRSGALLGFPDRYALKDIMPCSAFKAFEMDFDKNKTSWFVPMTKWAEHTFKSKEIYASEKIRLMCACKHTLEEDVYSIFPGQNIISRFDTGLNIPRLCREKVPCPYCGKFMIVKEVAGSNMGEKSFKIPRGARFINEEGKIVRANQKYGILAPIKREIESAAKDVEDINKC